MVNPALVNNIEQYIDISSCQNFVIFTEGQIQYISRRRPILSAVLCACAQVIGPAPFGDEARRQQA
jgi:hypothetical protein